MPQDISPFYNQVTKGMQQAPWYESTITQKYTRIMYALKAQDVGLCQQALSLRSR